MRTWAIGLRLHRRGPIPWPSSSPHPSSVDPSNRKLARLPVGKSVGPSRPESGRPRSSRSSGRTTPFEVGDHVLRLRVHVGTPVGGDHPKRPQTRGGKGKVRRRPPPTGCGHPAESSERNQPQVGPPGHSGDRRPREEADPTGGCRVHRALPGTPGTARDRSATAVAPTRGPAVPRPPGTMRVVRENSRPARSSISS